MAWQQDQNADDIVRSVVAGQQRRAINRARGTDERCLLYPRKQTSLSTAAISVKRCQELP
jgi:hypothetical protein